VSDYTKTNWQANVTPVSPNNMNKIEDGIDTAHSELDTHAADNVKHVTAEERTAWNGKLDKTGGTMTGALVAQANTNYGTSQVRNIRGGTADPTGIPANGELYVKYK
jgi:hypothetical protein